MSDLKPVSRPSFLLDGRGSQVLALIGLAIVIAFLKPWGSPGTPTPVPSAARVPTSSPLPSPSPSPTRPPDPLDADSRPYDPLIFGDHELRAAWGLWPAGYMVSFGFAMRAEPSSPPSGGRSLAPTSLAEPASPIWPEAIDILFGNHLLLIGVNTPNGFSVDDIHLTRYLAGGRSEDVPIVRPPSPWPSHFNVIGVDGGYGVSRTAFWIPGRYRLDLVIDPGTIERSIEIRIEGAPVPGASGPPSPTLPPSPSASPTPR